MTPHTQNVSVPFSESAAGWTIAEPKTWPIPKDVLSTSWLTGSTTLKYGCGLPTLSTIAGSRQRPSADTQPTGRPSVQPRQKI